MPTSASKKPMTTADVHAPLADSIPLALPSTSSTNAESCQQPTPWCLHACLAGVRFFVRRISSKSNKAWVAVMQREDAEAGVKLISMGKEMNGKVKVEDPHGLEPKHPGKNPKRGVQWFCFRGQHAGTYVRGVQYLNKEGAVERASWSCVSVKPLDGEPDEQLASGLMIEDADLVICFNTQEDIARNMLFDGLRKGSRD